MRASGPTKFISRTEPTLGLGLGCNRLAFVLHERGRGRNGRLDFWERAYYVCVMGSGGTAVGLAAHVI